MHNLKYIADSYYQMANYKKALAIYQHILKQTPQNDEVIRQALLANMQMHAFQDAKLLATKLLKLNPTADNLVLTSKIFYHEQDYHAAEKYLSKALKKDSQNLSALITCGNIFYMQKKYAEALEQYQKALTLAPNSETVLLNLAKTSFELRKFSLAEKYAKKLEKQNHQSEALATLLGNIYLEKQDGKKALNFFKQALKFNQEDAWTYAMLSRAHQLLGNNKSALNAAWQALEKSGGDNAQQINFAYLIYEILSDISTDSLQKYLHKWQKKYPENSIVKYTILSVNNSTQTNRADPEYVEKIFDNFADGFEEVLSALDYKVPTYIKDFMAEFYPKIPFLGLRILDLGCGTGLCAKTLKSYARFRRLDGVDISPKMLKKAAEKKLYSHLYSKDLQQFLPSKISCYDLAVAADVFTYFGALENLFKNICSTLVKHGRIIFTVSKNTHNKQDFFLHASGRFQHSKNYIKKLLKNNGFILEKISEKSLRNEGGKRVLGYIVSARKQ